MRYLVHIPGIPKGQARPRFARVGGFVRTYDPKDATLNKASIASFAAIAGVRQCEGPVEIEIEAFMPRPKRLMRKADPDEALPATCKPDCDNIAKAVCDALIGVAYADDAQVVRLQVLKRYHAKRGMPGMYVSIINNKQEDGK